MQRGLAPILIILLLVVILGIGGYFVYTSLRGVLSPSKDDVAISPTSTPQPSPAPSDETVYTEASRSANWKTYVSDRLGYSIKIPLNYSFKEDKQNNWEQFYLPKDNSNEKDYWEEQVVVWTISTSDTDPCNPSKIDLKKAAELWEIKCVIINNITFRRVAIKLKKSEFYSYVTIYKGKNYSIAFTNVELSKREQIISTFKFTQ